MLRRTLFSFAIILFCTAFARPQAIEIPIETGKHALANTPVRIPLQWPEDLKNHNAVVIHIGDTKTIGQLVPPSFTTEAIVATPGKIRKDLVFIAPALAAEKPIVVRIPDPIRNEFKIPSSFAWTVTPDDHADLSFGPFFRGDKTPVLRYMCKPYDPSSEDTRNRTYKPFHHVFDPSGSGKILTNGGHTDNPENPKDMVYPHHRGLMFGFNKCTYDGKTADTWHCTNGVHVSHNKTIHQVAGPVLGEHRVLLDWVGPKDDVFAQEERQMTAYKVPGGTLIEFASRLTPKVSKVKLDGDPQHAGFQFRAHNDVAKKTAKETYYLRPDGKGKMGETRNWDPKNKGPVDLPWDVLSFVLDGKRYSVEYIDHPNNPGEKRYSERDYGRFGCYFEYDLTPENPLVLNHRIWVQDGEMTAEQAQKLRDDFVNPPSVK